MKCKKRDDTGEFTNEIKGYGNREVANIQTKHLQTMTHVGNGSK